MLKTLFASLFACALLLAQTTGTVVYTPPSPGSFTSTGGSIVIVVTGNANPATAILVSVKLGAVTIPTYTIPLPANAVYSFDQRYNGDVVTVMAQSSASGAVTWIASAAPNGGTPGTYAGTL